ncbi:MAG: hypothetical protein IPM04_15340 [Saprospiraceae bacterium]|nr:hypothetical protein [Candidatus Brachybacter algidus]MBK8749135.1 hypothetical protein [Candidatus Brachybacter algidus]
MRYENINAKGDRGTYFQPMVITKWMREKSDFQILNQSGSTKYEMVSGKDFTLTSQTLALQRIYPEIT